MEGVHKPGERPFVSAPVDLPNFLREASKAVADWSYGTFDEEKKEATPESALADICERMGVSEEEGLGLVAKTHPNRLLCGDEVDEENPFNSEGPPGDSELRTLAVQAAETQRKETKLSYRQEAVNRLKYRRYNFRIVQNFATASPFEPELRLLHTPDDLIITVAFCSPYNAPLQQHKIRLGRLLRLDTAFLVRGRTKLTELRDRIACPSDFASNEDVSDDPHAEHPTPNAKLTYPSGFFFIDDVFYDDMRDENADRLSQSVLDWARERRGIDATALSRQDMSEMRVGDLSIRFGSPQLYLHQGSCEHLWMLTSARVIGPDDPQDLRAFPIPLTKKTKNRVSCAACKHYIAKFVLYGSDRGPSEPAFLCGQCLTTFHYDAQGKKIGDFKVARFLDKSALVN